MSEWEAYGEQAIVTAWQLLKEHDKAQKGGGSDG